MSHLITRGVGAAANRRPVAGQVALLRGKGRRDAVKNLAWPIHSQKQQSVPVMKGLQQGAEFAARRVTLAFFDKLYV